MKLFIPVVETIQKRRSIRTYERKPLLPMIEKHCLCV